MTVRRIVANFSTPDPKACAQFYRDLLGLDLVMDLDWIVTLAGSERSLPQISLASQGGSGTPVPDLSVEVDDVDEVHARALACGIGIIYPLSDEPWGVRRFYVREPGGRIVRRTPAGPSAPFRGSAHAHRARPRRY